MRVAPLFFLLATLGCADGPVGPGPARPVYELVFEGEREGGERLLFRATLDDAAAALLGSGHTGHKPQPSPDGQRIAFHSVATHAAPSRLMVLPKGAAAPVALTGGTTSMERELTWSPAGTRIAFTCFRDDAYGDICTATVAQNRLVAVRNLVASPAAETFAEMTPAWSPDGHRIAFTSYRGGSPAIWTMRADGSQPRQVTETGAHGDYFPSWSPDGQSIAFQRNAPSGARIGIVAAEGGTPRFLAWPSNAYTPAWSPDGDHLAIAATVGDDEDVFVVSLEGTPRHRIRRPGRDLNPTWLRVAR